MIMTIEISGAILYLLYRVKIEKNGGEYIPLRDWVLKIKYS